MNVHFDTCLLIDALTGPRRSGPKLAGAVRAGHRLGLSAPALFEWLRGPRTQVELADQEALFQFTQPVAFDASVARRAAEIYRALKRPRSREIDIAIAACAIEDGAALWTLNIDDFDDIPGLTLYTG